MTSKAFAEHFGLAPQTLVNWRHRDKVAGRSQAAPGHPKYRRFGKSVRYWLEDPIGGQQVEAQAQ